MLIQPSRKSGFTLVEAAVLLAIVVLLVTLAVPNYFQERRRAQREACVEQLRQIGAAKDRWAKETQKPAGSVVPPAQLAPLLKHGVVPACPADGAYSINPIGAAPACSLGATAGHTL